MDRVKNSKFTTTFRVHYKKILMMVSLDTYLSKGFIVVAASVVVLFPGFYGRKE